MSKALASRHSRRLTPPCHPLMSRSSTHPAGARSDHSVPSFISAGSASSDGGSARSPTVPATARVAPLIAV